MIPQEKSTLLISGLDKVKGALWSHFLLRFFCDDNPAWPVRQDFKLTPMTLFCKRQYFRRFLLPQLRHRNDTTKQPAPTIGEMLPGEICLNSQIQTVKSKLILFVIFATKQIILNPFLIHHN